MAVQTPLAGFTGSIANIVGYTRRDSDKHFMRSLPQGMNKERIKNDPNFLPTRQNNSEFGGRSTGSRLIRDVLKPLNVVVDYNLAPVIAGKLTTLQKLDVHSPRGERAVCLSRNPQMLDGFPLNRKTSFDSIVPVPIECSLSRATRSARISIPALVTNQNFFPQKGYPLFQVLITLGMVGDVFFTNNEYVQHPDTITHNQKLWQSAWQATAKGMGAQNIEITLGEPLGDNQFTMLLAIAVCYGKISAPDEVEAVRYVGAGKIFKGN